VDLNLRICRSRLPQVSAIVQEILTGHFFITQPHYLHWMLKLKDAQLRI
jgi:hypothetical protein